MLLGHPLTEKKFGYRVIEPTGDTVVDSAAYSAWVSTSPRPSLSLSPTGLKFIISTAPPLVSSGNFRIEGNGVEMVQKFATTPLLNVQRAMTTPQDSVSASLDSGVVDVDYDISGTSALVLVTRVRLTNPGNIVNYPPDSLVELSSEDVAPHGSATVDFPRMGQVLRVARTENDGTNAYIYFATTVWRSDLYLTDIRVTLMPVGETYINNLKLSIEAGSGEDIETRTQPVIWLQNCPYPKVTNCEIIESASNGMVVIRGIGGQIKSNTIKKVRFSNGEGAPSNGRNGYGLFWSACNGMSLHGNYFTNVRHAVTDNWTNGSAAGLVHRHGPNIGNVIQANVVEFPHGAGIDSHSSAIGTLFLGNTVFGARSDNSVTGAGYQIRGEGNVLQGNTDYNCEVGIQCFENTIDGSQDTVIQNHTSRAKKIGLITAVQAGITSTRKQNIHIIGGLFETSQVGAAAGKVFQIDNAKVNFRGTIVRPHGQNGGNIVTNAVGNADVSGEIIYDASAAAGAWALLSTTGTGNTFALKTRRDSDDGVGGDAALVITDLSPDYTLFATTLTADRAVTFSCTGRKRVTIYRTAGGAFNLNITHSGGTLALASANRGATFEVFGSTVLLADAQISSVVSLPEATAIADTDLLRIERAGVSMKVLRPNVINQRFITSGTVTAAATLDLAIPADCDVMEVELWNWLPATNSSSLYMRFSQSAAFLAGASDYKWGYQAATAGFADAADNQIELNSFVSNVAGQIGNINVRIFRPNTAATTKSALWYGGYHNTSNLYIGLSGAGNMLANTNAVDGVRFLFSSGNITSGFYAVRAFKYA